MAPVFADVVWPALYLEMRLLSSVPIVAGLIVECFVLRYGFGLTWKRAVWVDVVMNAVSTAAGVVLIPIAGIMWEIFPGSVMYKFFNIGTFNPATWTATYVMAVLLTTAIEAAVVKWLFKIPLKRGRFWMLCGANAMSVGIAFVSLMLRPPLP